MTGHFASVCRTKNKQEHKKKDTRRQRGRGKVHCVEDDEDDEYPFTVGVGKSCEWSGSETVDLQVGGVILMLFMVKSECFTNCEILQLATRIK